MRISNLSRLISIGWIWSVVRLGFIEAQFHFESEPLPSQQRHNDGEQQQQQQRQQFVDWHEAPDGTEEEVWKYFREKGDTMFVATLAQGLSDQLTADSPRRLELESCAKSAFNSRQYAKCILPLMRDRLDRMRVDESLRKRFEERMKFEAMLRRDLPPPPQATNKHGEPSFGRTEDGSRIVHKAAKWSDMELPGAHSPFVQPTVQGQVPPGAHGQQPQHQQSSNHHSDMTKMSMGVANVLTDFVKHLKNMTGPWGKMPDLDEALKQAKDPRPRLSNRGLQPVGLLTESGRGDDSIFHTLINNVMTAPLFLMKDSIQMAKVRKTEQRPDSKSSTDQRRRKKRASQQPPPEDKANILSPTILSMFDNGRSENPSFLSPDFLSLFESPNSVGSIPQLVSMLPTEHQVPWLKFMLEVTGASDYMRMVESDKFQELIEYAELTWYGNQTVPYKKVFDAKYLAVGEIFQGLNKPQWDEVNARGFSFMDEPQLKKVYGEQLYDNDFMQFDIKEYAKKDQIGKEELLIDMIDEIANNDYRSDPDAFVTDAPIDTDDESTRAPRRKRQSFAKPCFSAPYSGGTTGVIYLKAPQIVCPSIFSYVILGPLILSPYVLSPYVMGPFILSPEVLNPFILSPYILSPNIINPLILSPGIINPTVFTPPIIAPFVLTPQIISPNVFSPPILSPLVLSPSILSPTVGSPNILSPLVLNPSILSPAVLFVNVLSPGILSPSILSPADGPNILSPCALCRRKKRETNFEHFDRVEFSKKLYWTGEPIASKEKSDYWSKEGILEMFPNLREPLKMLRKLFGDVYL